MSEPTCFVHAKDTLVTCVAVLCLPNLQRYNSVMLVLSLLLVLLVLLRFQDSSSAQTILIVT